MPKQKTKTVAEKKQNKKKRSAGSVATGIICSVVIGLAVVIAAACYYLYHFDFNGTIMDNVSIAGVSVGGMTRKEARAAVNKAVEETYQTQPMVVKIYDVTVEIPADTANIKLNSTLAVWDAYRYGRRGFASQVALDQDRSQYGGIEVNVGPYLSMDKEAVQAALSEFGNHYNTTLSQSTYEVTGTAPELTLVVHLGVPEYGLDLSALFDEVTRAYRKNQLFYETECVMLKPEPLDLKSILEANATQPVNATYTEKFDVNEGINGCTFDIAAVQTKLDETPYGETVEIPFDQIQPEITGDSLRANLFRDELGHHVATQSSSSSRATNLRLACEAINGVILYPGDEFSYNDTLGERTTERGYKTGIAYVGGESVPSIGGGICQVSSTLYYCALQADLEIIERENHCYAPGYVPLGMDATVSWGSLNFRFKNNTDYPIRIDAVADGGSTTVTLVGTDTKDYYIKMEYAVTGSYQYETIYKEMKADNEKGYKDGDTITSPTIGYDVVTYRCKYNKSNDELISKDFEAKSHFSKRDAVICKIISDTPAPTVEPTTPGIGNGGVTEENGSLPE